MEQPVVEIDRTNSAITRIRTETLGDLAPGSVRFRVDKLALTANTITYAEAGDLLDYWGFWPSGEEGWGRVPAMGWADVVESNHPEVAVGGRYYGWFPMAGHVDAAVSTTATGLRDDGEHRAAHAPVYRTFEDTRTDAIYPSGITDPAMLADLEDRHAILRGLYLTGYLADAFFGAKQWFGAERCIVLSASSKTAIGLAEAAANGPMHLVGVTSAGNVAFVEGLGLYDEVITYDAVGDIPVVASVLVDIAGNGPAVTTIHDRLGDSLTHSMLLGKTHNDAPAAEINAGPTPEMFFAPLALQAMAEAGADVESVMTGAQKSVMDFVAASSSWLSIQRADGPEAVAEAWATVHAGGIAPSVGQICSMHE